MAKRDYYDVLGIDRNADEKEIKRAYRKLAKKYHPDTNSGDKQAEQKFKEVTEAYDVLGNAEKKKLYDQYGFAAFEEGFGTDRGRHAGQTGGHSYYEGGFGNDGTWQEFHFSDGDGEDIFGDIFENFFRGHGENGGGFRAGSGFSGEGYQWKGGNGFSGRTYQSGSGFEGGFGSHSFRQRGADSHADIKISFEEAACGCDKMLQIQDETGKTQLLQVHIPKGIDEGQSIRLKGKGAAGTGGGTDGDLMLKVHIIPKPGYERKGNDVYVTVYIPYAAAVLGGEVVVPTLTGNVSCRIPAGTQCGSKIRLKNRGIPFMKNPAHKGDEYIVVQIEVPKNLTPEERSKLMEYDRARKFHGHGGRAV